MDKLLQKLDALHENSKHQDIIDIVESYNPKERNYELLSRYARAMNNLGRYADALKILESISVDGDKDPMWNYRKGFALYHLNRHADAVKSLKRAYELGFTDPIYYGILEESEKITKTQEHYVYRWSNRKSLYDNQKPFEQFDMSDFWDKSAHSKENYECEQPNNELIKEVEKELGYKLPASYIWLMKQKNGGVPKKDFFPSERPTSWSENGVSIYGIIGIGKEKRYSICGEIGSNYMIKELGYPNIGVAICSCPAGPFGGYGMIFLDYTYSGNDGEPAVVHIEEYNHTITYLADDFESFIRGLVCEEDYENKGVVDKLIEKLNKLHLENNHQEIVNLVEATPTEEKNYDVLSRYARAMNNLERYDDALKILESISIEGAQDPLWHYRKGYALVYLGKNSEAAKSLERAKELGYTEEPSYLWIKHTVEEEEKTEKHYKNRWENRTLKFTEKKPFEQFDLSDFWADVPYATANYIEKEPTESLISDIEKELGYKLPASYIYLMKKQNGGVPKRRFYCSERPTSWSERGVSISAILGIGREKSDSICGETGSKFMIQEWGYPDIGVAICNCPSGGHDMVFLDYTHCGKDGEPAVVHVDQECNYSITYLADDFESFIRGLELEEEDE